MKNSETDRTKWTLIFISVFLLIWGFYLSIDYFNPPKPFPPFPKKELCEQDVAYLSCLIHSEAKLDDTLDMYLIGSTVLNRVDSGRFPETIDSVITQRGQYDGFKTKRFCRSEVTDTIARRLLHGIGRDYCVLFFYNPTTSTDKGFIRFLERKYNLINFSEKHMFYGH